MKNTNNILHLMGMDSTKYGGIERFNVELSHQLAEKGYHSVFVYERWPDVKQFADDLQTTGAEILVLDSRHNKLGFCRGLWRMLRQYNFCMMHAHFTKARFYAVPLALLYGIKNIVYTLHSAIDPLPQIKPHTRLWYKVFNKHCRVVAVSKQIEAVAAANWPGLTVKNLYLGIVPVIGDRKQCRKELGITGDQLMVMCTANFNHIKGLDVLAKAIGKLHQDNKLTNVVFYIVGQPEKDREELKPLLEELGILSYVHMEGISNQIPKYLSAADIYIQPSRSEGIGLALMEAASASLPLIASNVGGIPEVAIDGENAILYEAEKTEELANSLSMMIGDAAMRKQYGQKSKRIYEEKFQLSSNVQELIMYYQL